MTELNDGIGDGDTEELNRLRALIAESQTNDLGEIQARLTRIENVLASRKKKGLPFFGSKRVSNGSVIKVALISAAILTIAVYTLMRGLQWHSALSDLRAEPGIEIMSVRSIGPFKTQVMGLRDPLAPDPSHILRRHNISDNQVDLQLTEYHSLNTAFGRERNLKQAGELDNLRNTIISVVGNLSEENRTQREEELGQISEILLELRFPEAMDQLKLQYADGVWHAAGELTENKYLEFKKLAPKYILNGVVDLDNIDNYTAAKTKHLKKGIDSCNLLLKDYTGAPAHASRLARLIREYDVLCRTSDITPKSFELIAKAKDPEAIKKDIQLAIDILKKEANLTSDRIKIAPTKKLSKTDKDQKESIMLRLEL